VGSFDESVGIVWLDRDPATLPALGPSVRWVQLPGAGVDRWLDRIRRAPHVQFTSAGGVYARPVAEHAVGLLLAGVRGLVHAARTNCWDRDSAAHRYNLEGSTVAVVGAGAIGALVIELLGPFRVETIAVTKSGRDVPGAGRNLASDRVPEIWGIADHVVLCAPSTTHTRWLVGEAELAQLRPHSWVVNVARGSLVATEAVLTALRDGVIGGCALDVVDPEPLSAGHPLWNEPHALITPHVAARPLAAESRDFAARVEANLVLLMSGRAPLSPVDTGSGY
jgi:phosphoglycerate dehydrogenase-like enzyme